ncbi:MAG TPA: hypothetical protein PKH16_04235 [Aequorivita sp.]|jgi:uncharacterized protein DUF3108|nr:hypothetical protein [Aequorivita sp.]MBP40376.1 hypothetical protein [Aequorivita sp.]HBC04771.1 hypothetical protein [Aequorivita sp.]HNP67093.1 hypothetical protein [Aequorivita sp.]|tara:strand:- start:25930 stop:26619 length:690 start_codon:yes stop_codon:yes gene_type:complete
MIKTFIISLLLLTAVFTQANAQTGCSKFYPLKEGTKAELTSYDKKGKIAAVVDYTVLNKTQTSEGEVATMKSSIKDDKGKLIAETEYDVTCDGTKISIDYNSMVSPMMMEQFQNMEYDISGVDLEIPNNLSVGQELPDAEMNMKISMSGINMNMDLTITNRKVIGKEDVTTPAGTFSCFVITYDMSTKMGMTQTSNSKQWIAEGVGMVKQEDYQRGKVSSSSVLTKFSK